MTGARAHDRGRAAAIRVAAIRVPPSSESSAHPTCRPGSGCRPARAAGRRSEIRPNGQGATILTYIFARTHSNSWQRSSRTAVGKGGGGRTARGRKASSHPGRLAESPAGCTWRKASLQPRLGLFRPALAPPLHVPLSVCMLWSPFRRPLSMSSFRPPLHGRPLFNDLLSVQRVRSKRGAPPPTHHPHPPHPPQLTRPPEVAAAKLFWQQRGGRRAGGNGRARPASRAARPASGPTRSLRADPAWRDRKRGGHRAAARGRPPDPSGPEGPGRAGPEGPGRGPEGPSRAGPEGPGRGRVEFRSPRSPAAAAKGCVCGCRAGGRRVC